MILTNKDYHRKSPPNNTTVQLSTLYCHPERYNAQRHRRMEGREYQAKADHTAAKNRKKIFLGNYY